MHRVGLLENLAVDPIQLHADIVGDAAMDQRLAQRFIGVGQMGVFADDGDRHLAFRPAHAGDDLLPALHIRRARRNAEMRADLGVEAFVVIGLRHGVDGVDVARQDDALFLEVAEQRDLLARAQRDVAVAAAEQDVGLDAEAEQLFHRMLRRLGLELAGGRYIGDECEVDVHRALAPDLVAELADRLEERQALDIADRAADLDQHEILVADVGLDEFLDHVGDVRDHLHRAAEIFAAALALDHGLIDAAGGDAVAAPPGNAGVALVMAEIEIGLGAVIGDEDLAMLIRRHRPRIDIEIRIEFPQAHLEAARLQQRAERRRRKTLAERGDHAAGDKNEPRHGLLM